MIAKSIPIIEDVVFESVDSLLEGMTGYEGLLFVDLWSKMSRKSVEPLRSLFRKAVAILISRLPYTREKFPDECEKLTGALDAWIEEGKEDDYLGRLASIVYRFMLTAPDAANRFAMALVLARLVEAEIEVRRKKEEE